MVKLWADNVYKRALLVSQLVKNLPEMQETQIWSLGLEDPLKEVMGTYSNILGWEIS